MNGTKVQQKSIVLRLFLRYALEIAYNGTDFHGWQSQLNNITVQEVIEQHLSILLKSKISVMGCGRTDAGVHALQFFLHFDFNESLPVGSLFRLNQMLPKSIAIKQVLSVNDHFHARFSALSRTYLYKATTLKNPFMEFQSLFMYKKPDLILMNQGCIELLKHNDFASFCKRGADNKTTLCDLMEANWTYQDGNFEFRVKANRFLRNMVRALVGTLLELGYGSISIEEFQNIIMNKERSRAGKSVSPVGLYLSEIEYNWDEYRS